MYSYFLLPLKNQNDESSSSSSKRGIIPLQQDETTIIGRRNILHAIFQTCNDCYHKNEREYTTTFNNKCQTCQELEDWGLKYISKCMMKLHPQKQTTTTKFLVEQCGLNSTTLVHIISTNQKNKNVTNNCFIKNNRLLLSVGDEIHIGDPNKKDDTITSCSYAYQPKFKFILQSVQNSKIKSQTIGETDTNNNSKSYKEHPSDMVNENGSLHREKTTTISDCTNNQPFRHTTGTDNNIEILEKNKKDPQQHQLLSIEIKSEKKLNNNDDLSTSGALHDSLMNQAHYNTFQQSPHSTRDTNKRKVPIIISTDSPIDGESSSSNQTINSTSYGVDTHNHRNICVFLLALGRNMSRSRICILTDALKRKEIKVVENYKNGATHWVIDENMSVEAIASKMGFQSPNNLASYVNNVSVKSFDFSTL